jgi:hypothetical protein
MIFWKWPLQHLVDRVTLEESNVIVEWLALLLLCMCMVFIAILKSWAGCLGRICVLFLILFNQTLA